MASSRGITFSSLEYFPITLVKLPKAHGRGGKHDQRNRGKTIAPVPGEHPHHPGSIELRHQPSGKGNDIHYQHRHWPKVNGVFANFFGDQRPACVVVPTSKLLGEIHVEADCIVTVKV